MISWSRTWSISWHLHSRITANRQNCPHNRAAKNTKILSSSRVITKPFMTLHECFHKQLETFIRHVLDFLVERNYCSNMIHFSTGMLRYKKHNQLRMSSILRRRNTRYKNPQLVAQHCFVASLNRCFSFFTLRDQLDLQQKHLLRVEEMQCADGLIC